MHQNPPDQPRPFGDFFIHHWDDTPMGRGRSELTDLQREGLTVLGMPGKVLFVNPRRHLQKHFANCVHCMIDRSLMKTMNDNLMKSQQQPGSNIMNSESTQPKSQMVLAKEYREVCDEETRVADELRVIERMRSRLKKQWGDLLNKRQDLMVQLANVSSGRDVNAADPSSLKASAIRECNSAPNEPMPMSHGGNIHKEFDRDSERSE